MKFFVPYFEDEDPSGLARKRMASFLSALDRDVIGQEVVAIEFGSMVTQLCLSSGAALCIDTRTRGPQRDESYTLVILDEALDAGDQRLGRARLSAYRPDGDVAPVVGEVPFWEHWWAINASHASPLKFPGGFREDRPGIEGFELLHGERIKRVWIPKNGVQVELTGELGLLEYVSGPNISSPSRCAVFRDRTCVGVLEHES